MRFSMEFLLFLFSSKGIQNHWRWFCSSLGCIRTFSIQCQRIEFSSIHFSLTPSLTLWKWLIWIFECSMVRYAFASNWYLLSVYLIIYWICNIRLAFHWFHCLCSVSVRCYQRIYWSVLPLSFSISYIHLSMWSCSMVLCLLNEFTISI